MSFKEEASEKISDCCYDYRNLRKTVTDHFEVFPMTYTGELVFTPYCIDDERVYCVECGHGFTDEEIVGIYGKIKP